MIIVDTHRPQTPPRDATSGGVCGWAVARAWPAPLSADDATATDANGQQVECEYHCFGSKKITTNGSGIEQVM